jgi:lysophospholipase L1-like esterase
MLRWYAVKDNQTWLIKEGVGEYYSSYEVQPRDIGCKIMLELLPATKTTYGEYNKAVSTMTKIEVTDGGRTYPELIERTDFNNGLGNWVTDGTWKTAVNGAHTMYKADCTDGNATLTLNKTSGNSTFEGRFRFNTSLTGFTSGGYFNIYAKKNDNSYYKLNFNRGGNTKSLIVSLYKKTADSDEEQLLAKDETSLKNVIFQSAGEDNQYFYVTFTVNEGSLDASVRLEGSLSNVMKLSATDSQPLTGGKTAVETSQTGVLMIDSACVESATAENESEKQRVILIGDSTVKAYGDDNTIGGWGDYIVNYFDDGVEVINKAEAGMSSRSYINTGRFDAAMNEVQEGDYVLFQFGHNDQRDSDDDSARIQYSVILGTPDENGIYPSIAPKKEATPQFLIDFYKNTEFPYQDTFYPNVGGTFKWYMQQYIDGVRAKGGIPVLVTPVCRIFFDSEGKITPHFGENDGYVTAAKQLAEENGIECIDMFNITKSLYESYGVMTTQGLHNVKSDGTVDITHYNKFGANIVASKMADAIKGMDISLASHITGSVTSVDKTHDLKTAKLFVVGGIGAAADKTADGIKSGGYGDYLSKYLSSKITVENLALADKTAKSYIDTEEYAKYIKELGEGDYVMIAFGSTDGDAQSGGYTRAGGTKDDGRSFMYYLYNYYVKPAVEKKAVVILLTPQCDRVYDSDGKIVSQHQAYTDDVIAEVTADATYFVNLDNASTELYNLMGVEGSKVLNAYSKQNGISKNALSEFGAESLAKQILNNMKYSSASLKDYINDTELSKQTYMTRGTYVEMVMNMLGINEKCYDNFSDVASGKSYENAIANAKRLGFVTGTNGMFMPELPLTAALMQEVNEKVCKYAGINEDFSNVYTLAGSGNVSNEIGLYGVDLLFESLNK